MISFGILNTLNLRKNVCILLGIILINYLLDKTYYVYERKYADELD